MSDYDAVIVDLSEVSNFVGHVSGGGEAKDHSGLPIKDSADENVAGVVGLTELISRRSREASILIQNGGILICFAVRVEYHLLQRLLQWSVYQWLPQLSPAGFRPTDLHAGDGPVDDHLVGHPFTQFFSAYKKQLRYKVSFSDSSLRGDRNHKRLASNPGGEVVAVELTTFAPGKLIFLPTIVQTPRDEVKESGVILDCIVSASRRDPSEESRPKWVEGWVLPGLEELDLAVSSAEHNVSEAKSKVADAQEQRDQVAGFRKLLWTTGKFQLEPIVRKAFSLLGFGALEEGDRDSVLYDAGQKVAIAEVEGSTVLINVDKYRQLLDYVEDELGESGMELKGILVGNGFRLQQPDQRGDQFSEACRRGAERQRFCLL